MHGSVCASVWKCMCECLEVYMHGSVYACASV